MINNYRNGLVRVLFILMLPLVQSLYFVLNKITVVSEATDVTTSLDRFFQYNSLFAIPYVFWYVFTFGVLLLFAFLDYKIYFSLLTSIIAGMLICFTVYYFFPTTVERPDIVVNNVLDKLVLTIYSNDKPVNCFPSIHMMDTLLITLFFFKFSRNFWLRAANVVNCILIYLSTFYIKQHSLLDAAASTVLAILLYFVFTNEYVWSKLPFAKLPKVIMN